MSSTQFMDAPLSTTPQDEWLSPEAAADRLGWTVIRLWLDVQSGAFPAPDRIADDGPQWHVDTINNPTPRVRVPGRAMYRDEHLWHLYDELVVWTLANGHADVPQVAVGRPGPTGRRFPLGSRVSNVRTLHSRGALPEKFVALFEALPGWAWDHLDTQWRKRFASVLSRWPDKITSTDRAWISTQRMRWHRLRPEWKALFDEQPGMIDAQPKSRVDAFLAHARQWLADNPGKTMDDVMYITTMDSLERPGATYRLGKTALYYRRRKRGSEGSLFLSDEESARIEELPGWDWSIGRGA